MKFKASRLSKGNLLFPTEIYLEEAGITIKKSGMFKRETKQFDFNHITSIELFNPRMGYSTISLFVGGEKMAVHGFKKSELDKIKAGIDQGKAAQNNNPE